VLRLGAYLVIHLIGSIVGSALLWALAGAVPALGPSQSIIADVPAGASRLFGFEFMLVFIVSLTYLANVDQRRSDLGFKALSIGLAATVGHLFAVSY